MKNIVATYFDGIQIPIQDGSIELPLNQPVRQYSEFKVIESPYLQDDQIIIKSGDKLYVSKGFKNLMEVDFDKAMSTKVKIKDIGEPDNLSNIPPLTYYKP